MASSLSKQLALPGAMLLVLATVLPVAFLQTPPMIDVLGHMGRYELQTGLGEQPWLQMFYAFKWQVIGNLGADLLVQAAQPVLGVIGATRLAVMLVPLLAASGILLVSHQVHGRVTPFAVVALALIYSLPFSWGFLNFSLAMALALLAFTLWLRIGAGPLRVALFVAVGLLVWLCHTFGWAFLGILCTAQSLVRHRGEGRSLPPVLLATLVDCGPLLAPIAPMLMWRSGADGAGIDGWFDLGQKAGWIIATLRLDREWADKLSASLLIAGLMMALLHTAMRGSRIAVDRTLATATSLSLAAFILLPRQIFGSVFADMRLTPYVLILGLLCLRENTSKMRSWPMIVALLFLGFRLTLTGHVYQQRERALEIHLVALQAIPEHARLATLIEVPCQTEWALPWFSHLGSMALVRKHVFANDQWANSSMNPLTVRFPAAGRFATDDRQLFFPERCGMTPRLAQSLRDLPARAFTHVWIVGVEPAAIPPRRDLKRVWSSADAAVFAASPPISRPL
jgi:hypothetical protein